MAILAKLSELTVILTKSGISVFFFFCWVSEMSINEEETTLLPAQNRALGEGVGGAGPTEYDPRWWRTFDLVFLIFMILTFVIIFVLSYFFHWDFFTLPVFFWPIWVGEVAKVVLEWLTGFFGGLLVVKKDVKGKSPLCFFFVLFFVLSMFEIRYGSDFCLFWLKASLQQLTIQERYNTGLLICSRC